LQIHFNAVHLKIKNFECAECSSKVRSKGELEKHIKTVHLKEKNFECSNCKSKFTTNSYLKRHINICSGKQKFTHGEGSIMKVLESMNIKYEYNSSYKVKSTILLRWDFIIDYDNTKLFIEYNGRQHYEPVTFGGITLEKAEGRFLKQIRNDKIKDDFCKENNYKLLWISYKNFGRISEIVADFIIENTSWSDC
jgi:hypothetical protein